MKELLVDFLKKTDKKFSIVQIFVVFLIKLISKPFIIVHNLIVEKVLKSVEAIRKIAF